MDDEQAAKTKFQCRLIFAKGECDAGTKMTANRPAALAQARSAA
ncbi:MAG: hypothetical protein AB1710_07180 [Pseudomonadota bacterium]|jgi:hypothetical protein